MFEVISWEVIAASFYSQDSPDRVFTDWLNSLGHRSFVLTEREYTDEKIYFGAGHAYSPTSPDHPGSPGHYWVFISTSPPLDEGDEPTIQTELLFYTAPFQH